MPHRIKRHEMLADGRPIRSSVLWGDFESAKAAGVQCRLLANEVQDGVLVVANPNSATVRTRCGTKIKFEVTHG